MVIQHRWLSDNEPIYMHHVRWSLGLAKEISAHSSIPGIFFFGLLWKCIVVKLSLLEEKITAVPKSRPRGTSLPAACWCDAVYKEEEFTVEACCSFNLNPKLNRFQDWSYSLLWELPSLSPPPFVSKPRSWCSNTRADNYSGHRALSWLPFGSTLELHSTTWRAPHSYPTAVPCSCVSGQCACGQSEQDTPGET